MLIVTKHINFVVCTCALCRIPYVCEAHLHSHYFYFHTITKVFAKNRANIVFLCKFSGFFAIFLSFFLFGGWTV